MHSSERRQKPGVAPVTYAACDGTLKSLPRRGARRTPRNFLRIPPRGGNRTSTSTTQQEQCPSSFRGQSAPTKIHADAKSNLAVKTDPRQSKRKRKSSGMAVRGESLVTYHGNRAPRNHPWPRLAYPDPAKKLADLLARRASIGRIAPGHCFRRGQLLVGLLRTLRVAIRVPEIEQQRSGTRVKL